MKIYARENGFPKLIDESEISPDLSGYATSDALSDLADNVADSLALKADAADLADYAKTAALADYAKASDVASSLSGYLPLTGGALSGTLSAPSFTATSDRRLKDELEKIEPDLSTLSAYRYRLRTDGEIHVGLIAQDVAEALPEAVSGWNDSYLTLDYNAVVAALVSEVNRLKARVAKIESTH